VRRLLSVSLVLGACAAAVLATGATEGGGGATRQYKIVFDNAFGLVEGGDFRVGGVTAGSTTKFSVRKRRGHAPKAVVTAEINEPGFGDFRADASCDIKPQSLIGEYYVDCQPGSSPVKLKNGGTVPVKHTTSTIPQDLVNDILRRPYRERLRLIVTELGTGLAGRPDDLREVLRRAHPGLRETSKVLRILGGQNRIIENFIRDADTVVAELERNKSDVARWVVETGNAAEISATRREEIRQSLRRLPAFLDELRPTMRRLGELADEQTPLLVDLQRAAPQLDTFLARLGPFAQASRPAVRALGAASTVGARAFEKGSNEVSELRVLATDAPAFAKPLRQFLQTMDDRRRGVEDDPRANNGSPPAPDPTAFEGSGGFTGLETIWNFFFWQSLSINGYDDVGHALRVAATVGPCSGIETKFGDEPDDAEVYDKCKQWLGPYQPGITEDDPTVAGPAARRLRARDGKPAKRPGERRGPGEPDAGPLPGQRDISKPQVSLPPPLRSLLDGLPKLPKPKQLPNVPDRLGGAPDTELLDFLLGS
jgi:phospholipid/cholesterol/gamma-HCH transport system substrate-binding protein